MNKLVCTIALTDNWLTIREVADTTFPEPSSLPKMESSWRRKFLPKKNGSKERVNKHGVVLGTSDCNGELQKNQIIWMFAGELYQRFGGQSGVLGLKLATNSSL